MPDDPVSETFTSHARFVRALSASLATGEVPADDIEQEVWLATLRAREKSLRSERGWLRTVTRNAAAKLARDLGPRRARETAAARRESISSTDEILERRETRRFVLEEVESLEEPYREAILLRFYENMPPREIARHRGIPVATAKSHLYRGMQTLRERLEARVGSTRRLSILLLAAAGIRPLPVTPAAAAAAAPAASGSLPAVAALVPVLVVVLALVLIWNRSKSPALEEASLTGPTIGSTLEVTGSRSSVTDSSRPVLSRRDDGVAPLRAQPSSLPPLIPDDCFGIEVRDALRGDRLPVAAMTLHDRSTTPIELRGAGFRSDRDDHYLGILPIEDAERFGGIEIHLPSDLGGLVFRRHVDRPDKVDDRLLTFLLPVLACVEVEVASLEERDDIEVFVSPFPDFESIPERLLEQELTVDQRRHLRALESTLSSTYLGQLEWIVQSAWTMQPDSIVERSEIADLREALQARTSGKLARREESVSRSDNPGAKFYVPYDGDVLVETVLGLGDDHVADIQVLEVQRGRTSRVSVEPRRSSYVEGTVLDTHGVPVAGAHVGVLVDRYFDGSERVPIRQTLRGGACFLAQDEAAGVRVYLTEIGATDENGGYRIPIAFNGTAQVYVVAEDFHTEFSEVRTTTIADATLEGLDVRLRKIDPAERVRMLVVDATGEARPGEWFYPRLAHNPLCRYPRIEADEEGYVDVTHLVPGALFNVAVEDEWSFVGTAPNRFRCEPDGLVQIDWAAAR